jgi:hypothetical protein
VCVCCVCCVCGVFLNVCVQWSCMIFPMSSGSILQSTGMTAVPPAPTNAPAPPAETEKVKARKGGGAQVVKKDTPLKKGQALQRHLNKAACDLRSQILQLKACRSQGELLTKLGTHATTVEAFFGRVQKLVREQVDLQPPYNEILSEFTEYSKLMDEDVGEAKGVIDGAARAGSAKAKPKGAAKANARKASTVAKLEQ